jgi:hypothetical protein
MKRILALAIALSLSAGGAYAAQCKDPATGKFIKCPPAAAAPAAAPAPAAKPAAKPASTTTATSSSKPATGGHPNCTKGKPCGNSCIAKDKVCHK